jgi:hypothetical protein
MDASVWSKMPYTSLLIDVDREVPDPQSFVDMKFTAIMTVALRQNITRGAELSADIVDYAVNQGIPGWWNLGVFGPDA